MTASPTRLSRSAGGLSSTIWLPSLLPLSQSEPHGARTVVWALPRSLAATCGIVITFSSSGYLDVSVHRVPSACLCIQHTVTGCASRVPPFGDPRIIAHVQLPAAFRSLSRPSSALSAKASALRPFLLNLCRSGPLSCLTFADQDQMLPVLSSGSQFASMASPWPLPVLAYF